MKKPHTVSFEQAAAVPIAALTALQALRDRGQLKAGQTVLINGASGGNWPGHMNRRRAESIKPACQAGAIGQACDCNPARGLGKPAQSV